MLHWKVSLVLAVILILGAPPASGEDEDFVRGPLVRVSGPSPFADCMADLIGDQAGPVQLNAEMEPYLAVDPVDPSHLVAMWTQDLLHGSPGRGLVGAVSFNGGMSWRNVVLPGYSLCTGGEFGRARQPWLAFAPNGDLYASGVSIGVAPSLVPSAVLVSKSTDGGLSWDAPTALIRDTDPEFYNDFPMIAADPFDSNFVYAVWEHFNIGRTMFSRTTDAGRTWSPAQEIWRPHGKDVTARFNQIVILRDGTLVDFFMDFVWVSDAGGVAQYSHRISLIRSTDRGETWLAFQKSIPVADVLTVCPPGSFGVNRCVTDPDTGQPVFSGTGFPSAAVDPNSGNLYVVWEDARFSGLQNHDIAFSMSRDGGFTWSPPIRVNRTPPSANPANQHAFRPTVEVAADGTIAVTHYDFRFNDPNPGALTDYWIVHCHPTTPEACTDPANWSSENRLTSVSFDLLKAPVISDPSHPASLFLGEYMGLRSKGDNFLALFAQPHDADSASIFFRRVNFQLQEQVGSEVFQSDEQVWDESAASMPNAGGEPCGTTVCRRNQFCCYSIGFGEPRCFKKGAGCAD